MHHTKDFDTSTAMPVPNWLSADQARQYLEHLIDTFATKEHADPDTDAPVLTLKVTAGVGKTATALKVVARHADALLARGHVMIYCPTLSLAEQAALDFKALAPQVPSQVVRGRNAADPDQPKKTMCRQLEMVARITGLVPSITYSYCRKPLGDGRFEQAACATNCAYLAQRDAVGARVLFLSHAYLTSHPPIDPAVPVGLRIVDEKVWQQLFKNRLITLEDFLAAPGNAFNDTLRADLTQAGTAIFDGLQNRKPLHDHLRRLGIDTALLAKLAQSERAAQPYLDISPRQSEKKILDRINTFDRMAFHTARLRADIFDVLAKTETGTCNQLTLDDRVINDVTRRALCLHQRECVPRNAPLLMLDADADPYITEQIAPGACFITLDVKPQAEIVQINDLTLSNSWLLDPAKGAARRADLRKLIEVEVARSAGCGVLLVATKAVVTAFHTDLGRPETFDTKRGGEMMGAQVRWFGPGTQGINDFAGFATVILLGRLQPSPREVEDVARALFGESDADIRRHEGGALPAVPLNYLMSDDTYSPASGRNHPDARVQTMLSQIRESASLQAIARLRLAAPNTAKRVLILCNQPLPGLPVSRLTRLADLMRGLDGEPDRAGFTTLEPALRNAAARGQLGIRLSAHGLANDLPGTFLSASRAKTFRRNRDSHALAALVLRIAKRNGWTVTLLAILDPAGGRHPVPAMVFADDISAHRAAKKMWPGLVVQLRPRNECSD